MSLNQDDTRRTIRATVIALLVMAVTMFGFVVWMVLVLAGYPTAAKVIRPGFTLGMLTASLFLWLAMYHAAGTPESPRVRRLFILSLTALLLGQLPGLIRLLP